MHKKATKTNKRQYPLIPVHVQYQFIRITAEARVITVLMQI